MKDNKLYKVLRIIFLTLSIILMIFSLSKKFVHAASVSTLPFSYGIGSGYGYNNSVDFSERQISLGLNNLVQSITTDSYTPKTILFYEKDLTNLTLTVAVTDQEVAYWGRVNKRGELNSGYVDTYITDLNSNNIRYRLYKISSDGSFLSLGEQTINIAGFPHHGDAFITSDTDYFMYPLWTYNNYNINWYYNYDFSQYEFTGLVYAGNGGGFDGPGFTGNATGTLSPSEDFDGQGFDLDFDFSIDLNPLQVLGEEIRDGIGTLKDRVVEGFQVIGGKIDAFKDRVVEGFQTLATIPSKVSDIYDYITEPFDEEKFSEKFEEMELGQELTSFRTDIESFTGTFDVAPARAEDVRFSIPFTLPYVNQNLNAEIDFSFYERIRSIIVPFVTVFLIFGMVWSLIRSIPGILHGTSPDGDS